MTEIENREQKSKLNRRQLVGGSGAVVAASMLGVRLLGSGASAQEGETQVPATPVALGPTVPPEFGNTGDWVVEGKDLALTRFASESTIDSSNVDTLGVAWTYTIEGGISGFGAVTSNPIVIGDSVYIQDMQSNIHVLDKASGELKWKSDFNIASVGPNGVAVGYGVLVAGLGDSAEVVALDAATGELKWRTDLSSNMGEGVDMAPLVYDNTVYVSTVPGNNNVFYRGGQKGIFYALDISSGHVIWQWDTTNNLWDNARVNSGGGLWHPPAVDEAGALYIGVANAAPYPGNSEFPNASSRMGNNDYANCLVKLDPTTGAPAWYINIKPHDLFDLDNQLSPVLTTVTTDDGVEKKLVISTGKHGIVIAADQDSGQEVWRREVGKHQNDYLQEVPEGETVEVYPGTLGGVETPFAVANGKAFFPVLNLATSYTSTALSGSVDYTGGEGVVTALDVATGDLLWETTIPTGIYAGCTVTGDLVWSSGLDGVVRAFNVEDGSLVFSFQATSGINAPFAAVEDYLFVPAAAFLVPSADTPVPDAAASNTVTAYKLGATPITNPESKPATPEATPGA
jgi:glucose dehydrogenase